MLCWWRVGCGWSVSYVFDDWVGYCEDYGGGSYEVFMEINDGVF